MQKAIFGSALLAAAVVAMISAGGGGGPGALLLGGAAFFAVFFYLLPSFIAAGRKHGNLGALFALNLLLGWLLLPWVGALVWALVRNRAVELLEQGPAAQQPAEPAASPSVADELRKLKALQDDGLLTSDEYESQKRRVLGC